MKNNDYGANDIYYSYKFRHCFVQNKCLSSLMKHEVVWSKYYIIYYTKSLIPIIIYIARRKYFVTINVLGNAIKYNAIINYCKTEEIYI